MKLRFYPLTVATGDKAALIDIDGKEYLDFSAGWGVANIGYNHPRVVDAVCKAVKKISTGSTISAINEESVELAEKLKELLPGEFDKSVWYGHSGSDANEFIAKIVPYATGKSKMVTFVGSYHGQTMGAYAMSGHPSQSKLSGGSGNIVKIPYPFCYRCAFEKEVGTCKLFCLRYLENYIFNAVASPDQIGAVVIEAIQCDGGDVVPAEGFLKGLEVLCRKNNILLVIDEVKIGFGRTGRMFGFEHCNITPDAVIMGKPLGGGQPLSAVVGRKELMNSGTGMHLFTTAGNPVACASAIESLKIIKEENLAENAANIGKYLVEKLNILKGQYDIIGDVRGKGLVIGIELVKNKSTKVPDAELSALVAYRAYQLGLIFYNSGIKSNVLELTPPLVITKGEADKAVSIIKQSINDVLNKEITIEDISDFSGWN